MTPEQKEQIETMIKAGKQWKYGHASPFELLVAVKVALPAIETMLEDHERLRKVIEETVRDLNNRAVDGVVPISNSIWLALNEGTDHD